MNNLYLRYQSLLWKTIYRFIHITGSKWDLDDMKSIANVAFVKACQSHDPQKGKLSTHVIRQVWYAMASEARTRTNDWQYVPLTRHIVQKNREEFTLTEFLEDLPSDDTRLIVRLILDTPCDVRLFLHEGKETAKRIQRAVWSVLEQLGWTKKKIKRNFHLIKEQLHGTQDW